MTAPTPKNYRPHTLVVFGGNVYNGSARTAIVDAWSCTIRGSEPTSDLPLDNHMSYLNEIQTPLGTFFGGVSNFMHKAVTLNYIKANAIGSNGLYSNTTASNQVDYATPVAGGNNAATQYPVFLSFAATWRTAAVRGFAARGRMYAPINVPLVQGNGESTITTTVAGQLATMYESLLSVLANYGGSYRFQPRIYSGHAAEHNTITSVSVGTRLDSQRRRKNAVPEQYSTTPFVP